MTRAYSAFPLLILCWMTATGPAAAEVPTITGTLLRVALNTDIRGTNPGVNRDANTDAVMHHIVEGLVGYGEDLTVKPVVAESFRMEDNGLRYVFRLREGLLFHNGAPVTAAEVKWSWRRYLDAETRWQCRRWFAAGEDNDANEGRPSVITAIEAPDPLTVVFHLEQPSPLFLDRLANIQCISAILHPDSVGEDGRWIAPIGTGPYKLREWRRAEYIDLERFTGYRPRRGEVDGVAGRKLALAERLRFLVSPDAASTRAALMAANIDVYHNAPMTALEEFHAARDIEVLESSTLGWSAVLLQTRDPVLADVRIRRAIAHAIDRRMVVNFNTYGYGAVNSSAIPVSSPARTQVHDKWVEPSVEKARALLREAGYRGEPIRIQANRRYPNMYANAVVIQAMLHAAGFNAHIEVLDWATQLGNYYSGRFQLSCFSYSAQATPVLRYYNLIGDKDRRPVYLWESAAAAGILDTAMSSFDIDVQRRAFEDLHRLMVQDVPVIGLYNAHYAAAVRASVQGYRAWPLVLPRLWGVSRTDWSS